MAPMDVSLSISNNSWTGDGDYVTGGINQGVLDDLKLDLLISEMNWPCSTSRHCICNVLGGAF